MQTLDVDIRAMRRYQQKALGKLLILYVWDTPKPKSASRDLDCFSDGERAWTGQNRDIAPSLHHVLQHAIDGSQGFTVTGHQFSDSGSEVGNRDQKLAKTAHISERWLIAGDGTG